MGLEHGVSEIPLAEVFLVGGAQQVQLYIQGFGRGDYNRFRCSGCNHTWSVHKTKAPRACPSCLREWVGEE